MAEAIMVKFGNEGDEATVNLMDPNGDKQIVEITRILHGKMKFPDQRQRRCRN
jgi:hypothetical protein